VASDQDVLRTERVAKRFGAVTALRQVDLRLRRGEVLGLVGDNGAGKSTLIKILSGFHRPDSGTIYLDGEPVQLRSVPHARSVGIDTVYQDLALIPSVSVYRNMFLRRELVHRFPPFPRLLNDGEMRRRARVYLEGIGVQMPSVDAEVALLSGGQRQAVAIARSIHSQARILLLDEPLAAMGVREGRLVLDLISEVKSRGDVSMILVVHNYLHVFEVCDRVNLLRGGEIRFDRPTSKTSVEELTAIVAAAYRSGEETPAEPSREAGAGGA
jgi:ABC-type sugar transport system ATPase subunit